MRTRDALLRRGTAHRSVLAVVLVTVLLTVTLATTVAILHSVARDVATANVLGSAAAAERVVRLETAGDHGTDLAELDRGVRSSLGNALDGASPQVTLRALSSSYALPGPGAEGPDLTAFATYDDLPDAAELVEGRWPSGSATPVPVALPQPAASELGREVGERWTVRNRLTDEAVTVRLAGVFTLTQPEAPARLGDTLLVRGVEPGSFTTYGPMVVTREAFAARFLDGATLTWTADPDLAAVRADDLAGLRAGVATLAGSAEAEGRRVESDLDEVLGRVATPLTAVAVVVAVGAAPLLVIAGLTLLTAGRLLRDRRGEELALLRARGASPAQLVGLGVVEALALTFPAMAAAPWLAAALVALIGPADAGATPSVTAWVVAALAGLVVVAALVAPLAGGGGRPSAAGAGTRLGAAARVGADVVVVAGAAVAAWQLARYGGPLSPDGQGRAQADPLLVLAPALLVLAGCVVAMRLLPLALAAADPLAGRSRGLTGALATWTVGRRLGRQVGPVLTVLLAAAVVAFSLTWLGSWRQSTHDQATFATGADVRVDDPAGRLGTADLTAVPDVGAVTPVVRLQDSFGDADGQILALDAAAAGDVVALRDDLSAQPLSTLLDELETSAADQGLGLVDLPDDGVGVALDPDVAAPRGAWQVVVQDDAGLVHAVELRGAPRGPLRADLRELAPPLRVLGLRVRPELAAADVRRLTAGGGPDLRAVAPDGTLGQPLRLPAGASWQAETTDTGATVLHLGAGEAAPLPALLTRDLADALGDQELVADGNGLSLRLRPAGVVEAVPTVDPDRFEAVVVDLGALARETFAQTGEVSPGGREWWVAVDGDPQEVARALASSTAASQQPGVAVLQQTAQQEGISAGPVGTALVGVLVVALLAAVLASASGFAAATSALAPVRRTEGAWLRALGADRRQVSRLQTLERAGVLAVAGAAGVAVGLAVAWWTVPRISLADDAGPPFPAIQVVVPWGALVLTVGGLVLALGLLDRLDARRSSRSSGSSGSSAPEEVAA